MPSPLIIAHRGASSEKPENTLAAFSRAVELGVDGIELDVQTTADGVAVVFHDEALQRLTATRGRLPATRWQALRALRVRQMEPIPRLVEVLRFTRGRAVVQIELKGAVRMPPVLAAIRAARAQDWVILASFSPALVSAARQLAPQIPRMLISEGRGTPERLARQLLACGANGLSVNHRAIRSAAWLRHFQRRGFSVWTWTVNDARVAGRLAAWGVDALLGDDPALLQAAV